MFLGGADPDKNDELKIRIPSIKGALRFWYRAVIWERLGSVEEVRKREAKLFGSAETGQGAFLLRVSSVNGNDLKNEDTTSAGLNYLGYGLHKNNKTHFMQKKFIKPGTIIELSFIFKRNITNKYEITKTDLADLKLAVKALGFFGGLGARSRRGFGSLTLLSIKEDSEEIWLAPTDKAGLIEEYENFFKELQLKPRVEQLPEYSAFTILCKCVIGMENDNVIDLLDQIGNNLNNFRSYRKEKKFSKDHDIVLEVAEDPNHRPKKHPERVVFGLPHNYYFSSVRQSVNIDACDGKNKYRRASPLFIHIHQIDNKYIGVFLFLPAKFLPANMYINMKAINKVNGINNVVKIPNAIEAIGDFAPITDFLHEICQDNDSGGQENNSKGVEINVY